MSGVAIGGTGVYVPPDTIDNAELLAAYNEYVRRHNAAHATEIAAGKMEPLEESTEEFVVKATGIRRRHVVTKNGMLDPDILCPRMPERPDDQLSLSAEMSVKAARVALERARVAPHDLDGVICAASTMQRPYPQIAIEIQNALGVDGFGFDMLTGCSSATFALDVAESLIRGGQARAILCVNPEINTGHLNLRDRETHFIFGDACSAAVLLPTSEARGDNAWDIVSTRMKSVYSNNIRNNFGPLNRFDPATMGTPDKLITQKGRKVFKEVVPLGAEFILEHLAANGLKPADLKRLWLHQANINMNRLLATKVLGHPPSPDEAPSILEEYGNTSSAGSVIAFDKHSADLRSGDLGLMCSFGAGYSAGSLILQKLG